MTNEFDDDDDLDMAEIEDYSPLNAAELKANIDNYSSESLCEMIVCDRYFGCYREMALVCMEELGKRRAAGQVFDFEGHIEKSLSELPQLNFTIPNLGDVLRQLVGNKVNR